MVRAEHIRSAVHVLADATCDLGKKSDEGTVRDAVEAVNASVLRMITLALECSAEGGRMLA